ncbi:MAG TPA: RNA methyltransferase [Candidatus Fimimorpha excrementavium]|nr:RNA methyltransferase [Candidatus Fimimorpha excrementavium]
MENDMNADVKYVIQLNKKPRQRKKDRVFVVEGPKMYAELPESLLIKTYVSDSFAREEKNEKILKKHPFEVVKDSVFEQMSDTKTPQGILAVAKQLSYKTDDLLGGDSGEKPFLLVLDTIQDPGNLGTMMRAGEAAGVTGILMNQETVDMYNPKVIRSTMGALYRMPFVYTDHLADTLKELKKEGIRLYAAHLKGERAYDREDYSSACAFLIGNEANGLSREVASLADTYIKIPMRGQVESLNAAVAASVLAFEAARQRRNLTK